MVDDATEYVDVLLRDPHTRRAAERELTRRRSLYDKLVVDADPGPAPRIEECAADLERQRLFRILEDLVKWENTTNEAVLQKARDEIWQSWRRACADNADDPRAGELFDRHKLPAFHDPFAGGGALPLEAQRLGLESYASDLNPVAVLINKAMIEIPPKFAGKPPVNPMARSELAWGGRWNATGALRWTPSIGQETGELERLPPVTNPATRATGKRSCIARSDRRLTPFVAVVVPVGMWSTRWRCPHIHRSARPRTFRAAFDNRALGANALRCKRPATCRYRHVPHQPRRTP